MSSSQSLKKMHLVLVGGGHGHVQVLRALHARARPTGMSVTLIDPQSSATYSGMVPGCAAGLYTPRETEIELGPLAAWADADFVGGRVVDIELEEGKTSVRVELVGDGTNGSSGNGLSDDERQYLDVPFDAISIDVGSQSRNIDSVPGASTLVVPTRPIWELVRRIREAEEGAAAVEDGSSKTRSASAVVVVGGGAAGIELALAMRARQEWGRLNPSDTVTVLDAGSKLFPNESPPCQEALYRVLADRGIAVRSNSKVARVNEDEVILRDGASVPCTRCVWAAGAAPPSLSRALERRGLAVSENGWIRVGPTLQSLSHPRVFAAGDCCQIEGLEGGRASPPKAGVYAVRAGPVLAENLTQFLRDEKGGGEGGDGGTPLVAYEPQDDFLKLIMCGDGTALGFRFGVPLYGKWVWELKDCIDRQFMDRFNTKYLPDLSAVESEGGVDKSQYDDAATNARPDPLTAEEAATLLLRTDDDVDFQRAWGVLRDMMSDEVYKEEVLVFVRPRLVQEGTRAVVVE